MRVWHLCIGLVATLALAALVGCSSGGEDGGGGNSVTEVTLSPDGTSITVTPSSALASTLQDRDVWVDFYGLGANAGKLIQNVYFHKNGNGTWTVYLANSADFAASGVAAGDYTGTYKAQVYAWVTGTGPTLIDIIDPVTLNITDGGGGGGGGTPPPPPF